MNVATALVVAATFWLIALGSATATTICIDGPCIGGGHPLPLTHKTCVNIDNRPDETYCVSIQANICFDSICVNPVFSKSVCISDTDGGDHCIKVNA